MLNKSDHRVTEVNNCHKCLVSGLGLLNLDSEKWKQICYRLHIEHSDTDDLRLKANELA